MLNKNIFIAIAGIENLLSYKKINENQWVSSIGTTTKDGR